MSVLAITPLSSNENLRVEFLKESIQLYRNGRSIIAVRLFLQPLSDTLSGIEILLDKIPISVTDKTHLLFDPSLMNLLKENTFKLHSPELATLDSFTYSRKSFSTSAQSLGKLGKVTIQFSSPSAASRNAEFLALQVLVETEREAYGRTSLYLFGSVPFKTHFLFAPSTIDVDRLKLADLSRISQLEAEKLASCVNRAELWVAVEGRIEAVDVSSEIPLKRNQPIRGASPMEAFYSIPAIKRGWELCINSAHSAAFHNRVLSCSFKHQKIYLIMGWIFGIATLIGLIIGILSLR